MSNCLFEMVLYHTSQSLIIYAHDEKKIQHRKIKNQPGGHNNGAGQEDQRQLDVIINLKADVSNNCLIK